MNNNEKIIKIDASKIAHRFLPTYRELKKAIHEDYIICYGSGSSGKSYSLAQFFVKKLIEAEKPRKLVVIRKVAADIKNSVFSQFVDTALPFFKLQENKDYKILRSKGGEEISFNNGSKIIFKGIPDAERFKSINGVTDLWIEEATEFAENEFKTISDRIRGSFGDKVQIYLSFNPISEDHWIKGRFFDKQDLDEHGNSRVKLIFSTYHDNPFTNEKFIRDMEWYKQNDPYHYKIYGLGQWGTIPSENPFIRNIDYNKSLKTVKYIKGHHVFVAMDFNVKWSMLVMQDIGGQKRFIDAIHDYPEECIMEFMAKYGNNFSSFTGDFSGNGQTQYTSDASAKSAWGVLFKLLDQKAYEMLNIARYTEIYVNQEFIPHHGNIGVKHSRIIMNMLFAEWSKREIYFEGDLQPGIVFDLENTKLLISDCRRISADNQGSLNKTELNRLNIGHLLDTFRYMICYYFYEEFKSFGLYNENFGNAA